MITRLLIVRSQEILNKSKAKKTIEDIEIYEQKSLKYL